MGSDDFLIEAEGHTKKRYPPEARQRLDFRVNSVAGTAQGYGAGDGGLELLGKILYFFNIECIVASIGHRVRFLTVSDVEQVSFRSVEYAARH